MIRATLVYLIIGLFILLAAPPVMLWTMLSRDSRFLYRMARFCIRMTGSISGVRVLVEGREKIKLGKTYVFLSNHLGNFDGPVLCSVVPRDLRALIKQEIMHVPILSLVLKQARFVPIDRRNPKQAQAGIDLAAQRLSEGLSFFAFPEGTRSKNGRLGEFKKGAFIMAIKSKSPVIPVTISGTDKIQRPGKYGIRSGTIHVVFHDPIATEEYRLEDRDRLMQLTRDAIESRIPGLI